MLARHPAKKTVYVEGMAASMASLIAMVGDRILIAPSAVMMIHMPVATTQGGAEELRRSANVVEMMGRDMTRIYSDRTGLPYEQVAKMMAEETWFSAEEAVKYGFADAIEGQMTAAAIHTMAGFNLDEFRHAPGPKTIGVLAEQYWNARGKRPAQLVDSSEATARPFLTDSEAIWSKWKGGAS